MVHAANRPHSRSLLGGENPTVSLVPSEYDLVGFTNNPDRQIIRTFGGFSDFAVGHIHRFRAGYTSPGQVYFRLVGPTPFENYEVLPPLVGTTPFEISTPAIRADGGPASVVAGRWYEIMLDATNMLGMPNRFVLEQVGVPEAALRNEAILINPGGAIRQRAGGTVADGQYGLHDRWVMLTQSVGMTPSHLVDVRNGIPHMMRTTNTHTSAQRGAMEQIVESDRSKALRGRQVQFFGTLRRGTAGANSTRFAILSWNGTADAVTRDVVLGWAQANDPNTFFIASVVVVASGAITTVADTLHDFSVGGIVPADCNNLIAIVWTATTMTISIGYLDLVAQMIPGSAPPPVMELRSDADEARSCRYYYETKTVQSQNGARHIPFLRKRVIPTITVSVGSASAITMDGFELTHTAAAACVVTADSGL